MILFFKNGPCLLCDYLQSAGRKPGGHFPSPAVARYLGSHLMLVRHDLITCYAVRTAGESHEFLQLRRSSNDFMGGTWQAVSGGIEPGETAWQAAIRELKEEAGLTPVEFYRLPVVNTFYISEQDTLWHSVPFCAIVGAEASVTLNQEHDAARWIGRNNIDKAFMWATDRSAIAELCKTILDGGDAKAYLRIPIEPS